MYSATSFSRNGLSDWIIQRVSAVILGLYFLWMVGWLLSQPSVTYDVWHDFMTSTGMRIFSLLALLSLAGHAWVGLWTIVTDYLTTRHAGPSANVMRLLAEVAFGIAIFVYVVWGIQILWGN